MDRRAGGGDYIASLLSSAPRLDFGVLGSEPAAMLDGAAVARCQSASARPARRGRFWPATPCTGASYAQRQRALSSRLAPSSQEAASRVVSTNQSRGGRGKQLAPAKGLEGACERMIGSRMDPPDPLYYFLAWSMSPCTSLAIRLAAPARGRASMSMCACP